MPKSFDYINDLSHKKVHLLEEDPENEKGVKQFFINRAFSLGPDTVMYANEMNKCQDLTKKMFYDFYFHSLRPKKRYRKWPKKDKTEYLEVVQKYYQFNNRKAQQALRLLTIDQLKELKSRMDEGGK